MCAAGGGAGWFDDAMRELGLADLAMRNHDPGRSNCGAVPHAIRLIAETRIRLPDRASAHGHVVRAEAALLMAEAWSTVGADKHAEVEVRRARGHASQLRDPNQAEIMARASLASIYITELRRDYARAVKQARRLAVASSNVGLNGVLAGATTRWIAAALKNGRAHGDQADAVAETKEAQIHFGEAMGPTLRVAPIGAETKGQLLRWMATAAVEEGDLERAEGLLDENAKHYPECRRCAVLDGFVDAHMYVKRWHRDQQERDRGLAIERLAMAREEALGRLWLEAPIHYFEAFVLDSLELA